MNRLQSHCDECAVPLQITWGPTQGDGDNPWYEKNACVQCKGRLIDGRFKVRSREGRRGGRVRVAAGARGRA
eukprot:2309919-Rhodomonas_salina.1